MLVFFLACTWFVVLTVGSIIHHMPAVCCSLCQSRVYNYIDNAVISLIYTSHSSPHLIQSRTYTAMLISVTVYKLNTLKSGLHHSCRYSFTIQSGSVLCPFHFNPLCQYLKAKLFHGPHRKKLVPPSLPTLYRELQSALGVNSGGYPPLITIVQSLMDSDNTFCGL